MVSGGFYRMDRINRISKVHGIDKMVPDGKVSRGGE
jgi:hypothetical protein